MGGGRKALGGLSGSQPIGFTNVLYSPFAVLAGHVVTLRAIWFLGGYRLPEPGPGLRHASPAPAGAGSRGPGREGVPAVREGLQSDGQEGCGRRHRGAHLFGPQGPGSAAGTSPKPCSLARGHPHPDHRGNEGGELSRGDLTFHPYVARNRSSWPCSSAMARPFGCLWSHFFSVWWNRSTFPQVWGW